MACNQSEAVIPETEEPTAAPDLSQVTSGPLETRKISHEIVCTGEVGVPPTDLISVHSRISGQVSNLKTH